MIAPANVALIESGIRPVCDALNALTGVRTVYSCEGHPWRDAPPFVMFDASVEAAFRVHKLLGCGHGDGSLQYVWWLTARFTDAGVIRFVLEPNDYRTSPRGRLIPQWRRTSMNAELRRLAALLRSVQFAVQREGAPGQWESMTTVETLDRATAICHDAHRRVVDFMGNVVYQGPANTTD